MASNNDVMKKLRIALQLEEDDLLEIFALADFPVTKPQLSAMFRKKGHKHYKECQDQMMKKFLAGLALKFRSGK
ncbi:MAG TPA: DUF1456 family protein [bacterium]|nr:DUF1456 family protein [bacterium]